MKKTFLTIVLCLFAMTICAQEWIGVNKSKKERIQETLISSSEKEIVVDVRIGGFVKHTVKTPQGDKWIIGGEDMAVMSVKGAPNLPMYPVSMIVGDKAEMKVSVVKSEYVDFENVEIAPSKGNISRQINPDDVPYTYGDMYQQDAFYPAQQATLGEPYILRDFRGQNLMVYPYAYNPVTKTLRVYTYLRISAEKVGNDGVNQKLSTKRNNALDPEVKSYYERRFINYPNNERYTFLEDEGEMLIVCTDEYMEAVQPLVEWKNISGRPTKMVSLSSTGNDLKQYVQKYYDENPDFTYLLLVGEYEDIPPVTLSEGKSDNYYGMLEGDDNYEEVFVGRLSVKSLNDAANQVNRIIYYERDIDESATWLNRASGVAANEGSGHYDEIDYQHMDHIRDTLLHYTYTDVSQYYANVNNPTASQMVDDYTKGVGLINYCNHGTFDSWAVANFTNTNVHNLKNDNKLPIIWSVACLNGEFSNDECFAEAWMRAINPLTGNPTGAIGGMFSWITQPWIPPMYGQDEMNAILTEWRDGYKHTLGGASCNGNMYVLDMEPLYEGPKTHNTWILFGDPSMMVRTDAPKQMNVTTPQPDIFIGMTGYTVNAQADFGIATLSINGEAIASAYIEKGTAYLQFDPISQTGKAKLVVVGYNRVTEIKELNIVPAENPYLIYDSHELLDDNGQLEYGETANLSMKIKNVGKQSTNNITVRLSSESEYVTMVKDNTVINTISPEETVNLENAFAFTIKPNIPNDTRIKFDVICTNGTDTWTSNFYMAAYAPVFALNSIDVLSESMIKPGQTATLQLRFKNVGDATAYNVQTEVFSASSDIEFNETLMKTESVDAGKVFTVTTDFTVDNSVLVGSVYELVCSARADYTECTTSFELKVGSNGEDFETGDFTANDWKIEGPGKWVIDDENAYEGSYCVTNELIANNQYAKLKLQLEVLADGPLTFYLKTSCEEYYDYMAFLDNGYTVQKWHGETEWMLFTYEMKKGTHNLEWRYLKDSSGSEGEDKVYIDNIIFPPVSVVTTMDAVEDLTYVIENKVVTLEWSGIYDAEEYIVRRDGEVVATVTETSFAENAVDDIVTYSVVARNGNNYSAPAFIVVDPDRKHGEDVTEMLTNKISLYPNPTSGVVYVTLDKSFDAVVYNYQGQVVMRLDNNDGQIDMSNLAVGIYFVEIREGNNRTVEKVIVR